jgi:hypothetical protein
MKRPRRLSSPEEIDEDARDGRRMFILVSWSGPGSKSVVAYSHFGSPDPAIWGCLFPRALPRRLYDNVALVSKTDALPKIA